MFKKTCLYGVAAIALSLIAVPAHAQTASLGATTTSAMGSMTTDSITETDDLMGALSSDNPATRGSTGNEISSNDGESYAPTNANNPRWYDDNGIPFDHKYYEMEASDITLALQRGSNLPAGHFVLFMSATNSFASCIKITNPKYSTTFDESGTMTIAMGKFTIDARDMPRYPHYECNTAPQQAAVYVNLSQQLLQDNGVKKIKFKAGKSSENYLVKITDDYIQLTPETRRDPKDVSNRFRPLEVNGVATTMKHWFYPENTVILTAVGTAKDVTLESRLMELARSKGLTPLSETMPDHAHFRKQPDHYYFIDKQGRYKAGNGELFDYIQADAMKFGLEADEPVKKNVAVFIRKPGQYD